MPLYHGSCHCGAVRFEIEHEPAEAYTCDCSLCRRRSARMTSVHESKFRITQGADKLSLYQWNMRIARHYFCSVCGIYPFHKKRSMPDTYGVNLACLDDFDSSNLPHRKASGLDMTVAPEGARPEWTGPRIS